MLIQLETQSSQPKPRSVFYSYSHKDEELRNELDTHLKLLKQDGFISTWHDRKIRPGDEWDHVINENLNTADVILFLVSHNFLVSQYCRDIEVKRAMERYQNHEAILIPIIIKPCVWTSEAFAKLQVLPKNCRPLTEWPDSGFAQVAEDLRIMMIDMLYPQKPTESSVGQHGNWIIKLRSRPEIDSSERAKKVVKLLREFTEDYTINLLATASTQILDGEKTQIGQMLILIGSPEAFSILDKTQRDGLLAGIIDEDILSFYVIYGATVQGISNIGSLDDSSILESNNLLIRPGRAFIPPLIKGVTLPKDETGDISFIFDTGNSDIEDTSFHDVTNTLTEYFTTALYTKEENFWVNLSAYEADRMLPKELSGTRFGRVMLSTDCMLKQLTASFMHPDTEIGRKYWDAVYDGARKKWGKSTIPFQSYQKVLVFPKKSEVFDFDGDTYEGKVPSFLEITPNRIGAFVTKMTLDVKCEIDIVASKYNKSISFAEETEDFTVEIFRQIILPKLIEEVNESEHFSELRQLYSVLILAKWVRESIHLTNCRRIKELIDCENPKLFNFNILNIEEITDIEIVKKKLSEIDNNTRIEHLTPENIAFEIPENAEFFQKYVRLFKDGVFRCARNEVGDSPDERIIRVYFSGAIDFRNLNENIHSKS